MSNKTRVVLIGRHAPVGLPDDIEIVAQENITWATTADECKQQFEDLMHSASCHNAEILLQNVPGILAIVIARKVAEISYSEGMAHTYNPAPLP